MLQVRGYYSSPARWKPWPNSVKAAVEDVVTSPSVSQSLVSRILTVLTIARIHVHDILTHKIGSWLRQTLREQTTDGCPLLEGRAESGQLRWQWPLFMISQPITPQMGWHMFQAVMPTLPILWTASFLASQGKCNHTVYIFHVLIKRMWFQEKQTDVSSKLQAAGEGDRREKNEYCSLSSFILTHLYTITEWAHRYHQEATDEGLRHE